MKGECQSKALTLMLNVSETPSEEASGKEISRSYLPRKCDHFLFCVKSVRNSIGIIFLFISISGFAQKSIPDVRLSLDVKEKSLTEVLDLIAEKSGIPFSYNPRKLPIQQKINYQATDKSLHEILKDLSEMVGMTYVLVEDQIILKPERKEDKGTSKKITYSGFVKDSETGEALIGATLILKELQAGVVSNAFGFFSITVPPGTYLVSCSFVGYKEFSRSVNLTSSINEDIGLPEEPPILQEVIVSGEAPDMVTEQQTSKADLQPQTVEERPALFGEMDVIKSLESIPGIKLHSDGSTFYYVRGGNRDQNLILMDDAPIYNPSHMLGFFSTIIPDAVNSITVYRGEMPASMGGRLSSVLDVRTKKGNDQHTQVWGSASVISNKIGVEGPIRKDVSSYLVSGRFSRLKWIANLAENNISQFQFHDLTGKMNFKLDERNRIFFSLYSGRDSYFAGNSGITWANNAATFRWNHVIHDRLFVNTTLSGSGYDYLLYYKVDEDTKWNSHISNVNLKTDVSYFLKPENEIAFGLGVSGYFFNPGNIQTSNPAASQPSLSVKNSGEVVAYGNHDVKLSQKWGINYGLRLTSWTNSGEAFEFVFDQNRNPIDTLFFLKGENYKTYVNAEPRITVNHQLTDRSSIKTGFARNVQNVHLISNSISPFTSLEVWLPSSINIKPQASNQVSMGYYQSLPKHGLSLMGEMFYKRMTNQIDFVSHASTLLNPLVERELRFGQGTSYGVEFQLKKDHGRLRGWVGYSWSRAKRKFADLNQGRVFNAFADRPHQINLMLTYDISLRWNVGMNWNYLTGAPFSSPVGFYTFNGQEVPIYDQKNNDRLPDYHRLDISATYKLNKNPENKFRHSLSFSIYNFYGRKNTLFINYNKTGVDSRTFRVPANVQDADRVISQFYLFQFTPSVAYNFKWR
jgi:CarboxypepD_reg-like domain/TonB-dependent Receptor Plug Domain